MGHTVKLSWGLEGDSDAASHPGYFQDKPCSKQPQLHGDTHMWLKETTPNPTTTAGQWHAYSEWRDWSDYTKSQFLPRLYIPLVVHGAVLVVQAVSPAHSPPSSPLPRREALCKQTAQHWQRFRTRLRQAPPPWVKVIRGRLHRLLRNV